MARQVQNPSPEFQEGRFRLFRECPHLVCSETQQPCYICGRAVAEPNPDHSVACPAEAERQDVRGAR